MATARPSIIFKEALEDLKDRFLDRLVVHHVLSREQQDVALFNGRIDAEKIETMLQDLRAPSDGSITPFCAGRAD